MSARLARRIEITIIGISAIALVLIFQPFALGLYSVGAGLVVIAGLAFNLVPLCVPGRPLRSVVKAAIIILVIFVIVVLISLGSAMLYAWYVKNR
jgi:hypothetical protein